MRPYLDKKSDLLSRINHRIERRVDFAASQPLNRSISPFQPHRLR
jgi:hypothetical protein